MKVLWVDFSLPYLLKDATYPVGGWAVELRSWLDGAHRTDVEAGVLTWAGAGDYVGKEFPFELVESFDPKRGTRYLKYLTTYLPAMRRAVRRFRPDVLIQACASVMTGMAAFAAHREGVPFVYRVANDMDVDVRYKTRLKQYEQYVYRYGLGRSDLILCQNRYQLDAVRAHYPGKRAVKLHNPYAVPRDLPAPGRDERSYIAWLGVFQQQKNLPLLLRIAERLPDVRFRIAGTRGSMVDVETEEALGGLEGLGNVEFVGYLGRSEVMPFLGGAVALLNTSHYEGFSNTYLESFSLGTPVIAPAAADPDGIIGRLGLGRAVDGESGFGPAIQEVLGMSGDYDDLARSCRAYVRETHDPAILTNQLVEALAPLVSSRAPNAELTDVQ